MSDAPELKPCPFCGVTVLAHQGHQDITFIACDACGAIASFRPHKKGSEAFRAWNRRADLARLPEELASRLAEMLQACWPDRAKHEAPMESLLRDILAWHEQQEAERPTDIWRPVESAPKDGSWIIAWRGQHATAPVIVWWDDLHNAFEDDVGDRVYGVTHWMRVDPPVWHERQEKGE